MCSAEGGASSNVGGGLRVRGKDSGSDVDPGDVREFLERHTHMEVRVEGSDRHIVVLEDYNLLSNYDQVDSALSPLCAAPESKALGAMSDMDLSLNVACMALRVDAFLFLFFAGLALLFSACLLF